MHTTSAAPDAEVFLGEAEAFERFGEYREALDLARCALRWSEMGAPLPTRGRAEAAVVRYERLVRATEADNKARRLGRRAVAAPTVRRSLWREIMDWMRGAGGLRLGA